MYDLEYGADAPDTGRVTAFEVPDRLMLAWQLNEQFQNDPDRAHASEVEVRFIAEGPTRTSVELEHRGFERHGAGADAVHSAVDGPRGWSYCLDLFAKYTDA